MDAGIGVNAGFGFRRKDFQIDYAMTPLGELGSAHRLSATIRWGGSPAASEAAASTAAAGVPARPKSTFDFPAADCLLLNIF